jgi:hypothetical protein
MFTSCSSDSREGRSCFNGIRSGAPLFSYKTRRSQGPASQLFSTLFNWWPSSPCWCRVEVELVFLLTFF